MSKGSNRRPSQIDEAEAQANWDRIFGKKPDHLNQLLKDDKDGFNEETNHVRKTSKERQR